MGIIKNHLSWLAKIAKSPIISSTTSFSLEHINFNALLFTASLFSISSCFFNFIETAYTPLAGFTIFSSVVLLFLYYLSRFRNYYNLWISLVTVLLLLSLTWFMNGGLIGSVPYIYLLSLIVLIITAKRHQHNKIFSLFIVNISILYILEYYFGEQLVHPYANRSSYYNDLIFVFILVLFCLFFLTRVFKRSYDNEREKVHNQAAIIEKQNKEHRSSLVYASYLQKKIISDKNKLHFLFTDHFVLFEPKDVVSGDFYWIKERGNYSIIAVADCTGHGVPAAFLSIMGISLLEEIIKEEAEELNAAALLEKLRIKFISYLKDDDSDKQQPHDGIDLGICVVNYQDCTFQFSGANRSLILLRPNQLPEANAYHEKEVAGNNTLYSYKATKNTIGFNYKEYPFVNHTIDFHLKDTFYLFSDGYADQFDSENKKKFKVSRLKKEIAAIQELPMQAQATYLANLHEKWKGGTEQTDDILIIGLRM
jgi:hypothetical protein